MFKNKALYGAAVCAVVLSACSSDEPNGGNQVAEYDQVRYLKVAINAPGENTRAGASDFEDGTADENAVNDVRFVFYDANGQVVGTPQTVDNLTWVNSDKVHVSKKAEAVIQVGLNKGDNYPAYVMCYINPVEPNNLQADNASLENLRNVTRTSYKGANGGFAMNNSVYYGENKVTGEANAKISGTPISISDLYPTEADAAAATDANVDIYVERYASKVNYNISEANIKPYKIQDADGNEKTLTFAPKAWTVNADAPTMYLVKKFTNDAAGTSVATFEEVNRAVGYFEWNDAPFFRSYWACSPSYYATQFPVVSDNVVDAATDGNGAGQAVAPYALKYYSYNQITAATGEGKGSPINDSRYVLENTMGSTAFTSLNPLAAAPSALLVGQYNVDGLAAGSSFYTFEGKLYYQNTANGTTMLNKFVNGQTTIYTKDATGAYAPVRNNDLSIFTVEHPSKEVYTSQGQRNTPEWFVTLQITNVPQSQALYVKTAYDTYQQLTAANLVLANYLLWENCGNANAYTNGYAYFSLPIKHLGAQEATSGATASNMNEIKWDEVKVGSFGLVRNHVYTIQIDAINGIGTGINNPEYPIVPPMDTDNYWFKYRLNIQKWRIVPTQNATFN